MLANFDRNLRLRRPGHAGVACARTGTTKHVELNLPSTNLMGGEGEAVRSPFEHFYRRQCSNKSATNTDDNGHSVGQTGRFQPEHGTGIRWPRPTICQLCGYVPLLVFASIVTDKKGSPKEQEATVTRAIMAFNKWQWGGTELRRATDGPGRRRLGTAISDSGGSKAFTARRTVASRDQRPTTDRHTHNILNDWSRPS